MPHGDAAADETGPFSLPRPFPLLVWHLWCPTGPNDERMGYGSSPSLFFAAGAVRSHRDPTVAVLVLDP